MTQRHAIPIFMLACMLAAGSAAWSSSLKPATVQLSSDDSSAVLQNGFVRVVVDTKVGTISAATADFTGQGAFPADQPSIISDAFKTMSPTDATVARTNVSFSVVANTSSLVSVRMAFDISAASADIGHETWTLSLANDARHVLLNAAGSLNDHVTKVETASAPTLVHSVGVVSPSIYGYFDSGVVQMMGKDNQTWFAANDTLQRLYTIGGNSSLDVTLEGQRGPVVLVSSKGLPNSNSGFQHILIGSFPGDLDKWTDGWTKLLSTQAVEQSTAASSWNVSYTMAFTDADFPSGGLSTGANLPLADMRAMLTGIYPSEPGCLCTYPNEVSDGEHVAQVATTIARPSRGYSNLYNFFDPDSYFGLTAIMYAGDPYLQEQARQVIERSGEFVLDNGQLPHHFVGVKPTYLAISGATQTGPNTFWTLSALQYARTSGDIDWLKTYMPKLRQTAAFCFNLIEPDTNLLLAPGSLMIDVFIRNNYTTDSNAMVVSFLRQFAEAEQVVGNSTGAAKLLSMADRVTKAVNDRLWASPGRGLGGDDHFLTQVNVDNTTRDFVDYDSNLIAVAHGIPDQDRSKRVLQRIDSGRCSAAQGAGPQFVSERYYGPNDTTHGNIGDSWCSMGRIAWFDAHARRRLGQQQAFDTNVLGPIQDLLINHTWMSERLACDGTQQPNRTQNYFEYPSVVSILLREVRYGISIGLTNVSVTPLGPTDFTYHIGNVRTVFSASHVEMSFPANGTRHFIFEPVRPSSTFKLALQAASKDQLTTDVACPAPSLSSAVSDQRGRLEFTLNVQTGCTVIASI